MILIEHKIQDRKGFALIEVDSTVLSKSSKKSKNGFDPRDLSFIHQPVDQFKRSSGLQNMGNSCYLNAGLQCLFYTYELSNYFLLDLHL